MFSKRLSQMDKISVQAVKPDTEKHALSLFCKYIPEEGMNRFTFTMQNNSAICLCWWMCKWSNVWRTAFSKHYSFSQREKIGEQRSNSSRVCLQRACYLIDDNSFDVF